MMRRGKSVRRRVVAIAALVVAFAVAAPELAGPVGATTIRSEQRTEQTRPAARRTATAAQRDKIAQYIRTHPRVLVKHKAKLRRATAKKRVVRRRASRKGRRRTRTARASARRRNAQRRRARAKAQARKRRARRGAAVAKRKSTKKKKKSGSSTSKSLIDWAAILFLIALPFIAVALLLFGTDYRRRPRAPSSKKRRGVLVVTPVGRKY
jgi:cobalamin biosynthesis Mg chelatase CobN